MTEQREGPAQVSKPREPYVHSGGEQDPGGDRELPPYADRQQTGKSPEQLVEERGGAGSSEAGPRHVSQAEREGVPVTDTTGASPLGVGESVVTQGNERMVNTPDSAQKADQTDIGVGGASENIDPESPTALTGDQGG
ncbi:MAG: hypothetical protein WCF33_17145 [Pseudonocardiaceae bacterium]